MGMGFLGFGNDLQNILALCPWDSPPHIFIDEYGKGMVRDAWHLPIGMEIASGVVISQVPS